MSDSPLDRVEPILEHIAETRPDADLSRVAVQIRVRRIAHKLETETRRHLAASGMEFWELPVLASLMRSDGALGIGAIQDLAQITSGAVTNRVAKLEEAGAVRRTFDPQDRRQVNVEITDLGRQRFAALVAAMREVEAKVFDGLDDSLMARLAQDLREVMVALET